MDCQKITQKLHDYSDGSLQAIEIKQVKSHIDACPACQKELQLINKTWEILQNYPAIEPSGAYISNFYTRLTKEPAKPQVWSLERILPVLFPKPVLAFSLSLCLIFVSYFSWMSLHGAVLMPVQSMAAFDADELDLIENFDMAENYDVLSDLDFLENLEMVEELEAQSS